LAAMTVVVPSKAFHTVDHFRVCVDVRQSTYGN